MALTIQNSLSVNAYSPYIYATDAWENLKSTTFDGVDEYCQLGRLTQTESVSNLSFSMWMKTPSLASVNALFGNNQGTGGTGRIYAITHTDGSVQMVISDSIDYPLVRTSASDIVINTWYHIAFVYNGGLTGNQNRLKIYINGVSSGATDNDIVPSQTGSSTYSIPLASRSDFALYGNLQIDEFALFDYSLSAAEVTAIYNSGCPNNLMSLSAAKRPEHYWRMGDNDTYPTINDIGETGGNDGTMTNQESTDIVEATPCWNPYIVDTYFPQYAYSLRKLSSTATDIIRVRRSSDSAESDFSAFEIDDGTMLAWVGAGTGSIAKWYNQGTAGSTYDISNTTGSLQPRIVISGVLQTKGGLPCVDFDGTDDYLQSTAGATNTEWTFFSVSSANTTEKVGTILNLSDTTLNSPKVYNDTRTGNKLELAVRNTSATDYFADMSTQRIDTNQRLLSSVIDASKNMSAFDNGATGTTATYTGTTTTDGLLMGATYTPKNYLDGTIQELIIFKQDESANRVAIQDEINGYYSIY